MAANGVSRGLGLRLLHHVRSDATRKAPSAQVFGDEWRQGTYQGQIWRSNSRGMREEGNPFACLER